MLHLKSSHCFTKPIWLNKPMRFLKPHRFNSLKINELPPQYILKFILLLYLLNLNTSILSAQNTSVKGTKTDKVFANTTEIYKSKTASDAQVLAELESDYGIGDVVRISDAPPATTTAPLTRTTSIQSEKKPLPAIPKTVSANNNAILTENLPPVNKEIELTTASIPTPQNTQKASNTTSTPLSKQALVITSGSYKSDIEMPERKNITKEIHKSPVEKKSKTYAPTSVKSSKSTKFYKNNSYSNKKFLFFFKKTKKKSSKRVKYQDNNKVGCYKF